MKKRYVASCSFGKDSMATVLLALENNEPLTEVIYCEVMFDEKRSGEVPEHRAFIYDTAIPFLKGAGIKVHVIRSEKNFVGLFKKQVARGPNTGKIWAWPLCGRCYVQRDCKVRPIEAYKRSEWAGDDVTQYIGIADDEMDRLARLDGTTTVSLLHKYGKAEDDAKKLCIAHGLYSPSYEFTCRNGCFFCPNAKEKELRHLYDHHRDLWESLLELQALPNKTTELFTRERRFSEIDELFRMDDAQASLFESRELVPFDSKKILEYQPGGRRASP